jgi:hypothetical protein
MLQSEVGSHWKVLGSKIPPKGRDYLFGFGGLLIVCPILGCFLILCGPKFFEESDDTKRRDYLFGLGGYCVPYLECFSNSFPT